MDYKLKSVSDFSALIGISEITTYRYVRAGKVPHRRIGRFIRFSDSDIQSYLNSVKVKKEDNNEN